MCLQIISRIRKEFKIIEKSSLEVRTLVWNNPGNQTFSFSLEVVFKNMDIDELLDKSIDYPPFFPRIPKV